MSVRRDEMTNRTVAGRRWPTLTAQIGVELLIGMAIATLLIIVGWASSDAIRFVYGGY